MSIRSKIKDFILMILLIISCLPSYSLQGDVGAHDPSSIVKCGNTYWIFTTGNGIYTMYSYDLIEWTAGPTPFTQAEWPEWITTYVPDFQGHFWAPECVFMNEKYYLYYSCSTWGVKTSAIGLATNRTLDPLSPEYEWIDEGVVIYSNAGSDANCIDPSLFSDEDDRLWLSYGSYFGGIRFTELNRTDGLPLSTERTAVASGDCEASYVIHRGDYYYLFINRGTCCQGVSSTYHIQVGRSPAPTGPFLDMDGNNLNAGGGSTILSSNDNFIGPGCFGYFVEHGTEWATYHYYDGNATGMPTLGIANLQWDENEWPLITREWLADGLYSIANLSNYHVMQPENCLVSEDAAIVQEPYSFDTCQQWQFTSLGNGYYRIAIWNSELSIVTEECASSSGTPLVLGPFSGQSCEVWAIERTNWGAYTIASTSGNRVATLQAEHNEGGTSLMLESYAGLSTQQWAISDTSINITPIQEQPKKNVADLTVYPNPSNEGSPIIFNNMPEDQNQLVIMSTDGNVLLETIIFPAIPATIYPSLKRGIYLVGLKGNSIWKRLLVL